MIPKEKWEMDIKRDMQESGEMKETSGDLKRRWSVKEKNNILGFGE